MAVVLTGLAGRKVAGPAAGLTAAALVEHCTAIVTQAGEHRAQRVQRRQDGGVGRRSQVKLVREFAVGPCILEQFLGNYPDVLCHGFAPLVYVYPGRSTRDGGSRCCFPTG